MTILGGGGDALGGLGPTQSIVSTGYCTHSQFTMHASNNNITTTITSMYFLFAAEQLESMIGLVDVEVRVGKENHYKHLPIFGF